MTLTSIVAVSLLAGDCNGVVRALAEVADGASRRGAPLPFRSADGGGTLDERG